MSRKKFPEEFKIEAVRYIGGWGHLVAEVSGWLGVSTHNMHK